jgi:hypothetical protein
MNQNRDYPCHQLSAGVACGFANAQINLFDETISCYGSHTPRVPPGREQVQQGFPFSQEHEHGFSGPTFGQEVQLIVGNMPPPQLNRAIWPADFANRDTEVLMGQLRQQQ